MKSWGLNLGLLKISGVSAPTSQSNGIPSIWLRRTQLRTYVSSKTGLRLLLITLVFLLPLLDRSGSRYIFTYGSEKLSLSHASRLLLHGIIRGVSNMEDSFWQYTCILTTFHSDIVECTGLALWILYIKCFCSVTWMCKHKFTKRGVIALSTEKNDKND